ncbi:Nif3-like dinuclear metal center hexameric protein, partial [Buchnera aphidicola]|nr:Nif3-like dinuclear metal center hexameric protein [Buchnera aphidicola]
MNNFLLEKIINKKLNNTQYNDIVPNGLQIEGDKIIKKIVTGVTACQDLLDQALTMQAN